MSERDVAEGILLEAQSFPSAPPGACKPCEALKPLRAGVFFDGTNNNMKRDKPKGCETNVVRLFDLYKEGSDATALRRKCYLRGVGSLDKEARQQQLARENQQAVQQWGRDPEMLQSQLSANQGRYVADLGYNVAGMAGGAGGKTRLNMAYFWLKDRCGEVAESAERMVDVYGFSRGAALARTFVNLVNQALVKHHPTLRVRFLGIYDTVGSFGVAGDESDPGQNLGVDTTDARATAHFTARHELRQNFPLSRTPNSDRSYAGVHSDVGGSYPPEDEDKRVNHLAFVPFFDMHAASVRCGVEMADPSSPVDVEALRRQANEFAGEGASMYDPAGEWAQRRKAFWDKYIHQSHATPSSWWIGRQFQRLNPNHMDNSGARRLFDPPRLQIVGEPPEFDWKKP